MAEILNGVWLVVRAFVSLQVHVARLFAYDPVGVLAVVWLSLVHGDRPAAARRLDLLEKAYAERG